MERRYNIIPSYYSPMCEEWRHSEDSSTEPSHGIIYRQCNFHCDFCNNDLHPNDVYATYTDDEFIACVLHLLTISKHFKFSGGEQTLNPFLKKDLEIVKSLGGFIFLDSNGSRPAVIKELLELGLVDVLGISLKGLTSGQASAVTHLSNSRLCWDNVLKTLETASGCPDLKLIITYVFYNDADLLTLERFAEMIEPYGNVVLKLNNLLHEKHHMTGLKSLDHGYFKKFINQFLELNPRWKGRTIVVNTESAINNYSDIVFL